MSDRFSALADEKPAYLDALLHEAAPCAPDELAGFVWDGLSIALPTAINRFVEKFQKVFVTDAPSNTVRGWNQRMVQDGRQAPWTAATKRDTPITYGHYVVTPARTHARYDDYRNALVIDYPAGGNRRFDPLGRVVDYVAPAECDADGMPILMLGRMYLDLGRRVVPTPSYFLLARGAPVTYRISPPRA